MKVLKSILGLFLVAVILSSCGKTETLPFNANFEVTLTGEAPNATITINNLTTGADSYEWIYSEGASVSGSTEKNPADFTVDKAGEFTITLNATSGTETKSAYSTFTIDGNTAILTFTDLEFGLNAGDLTYGRLFSIDDGKIYKDGEITPALGPKIDLGFASNAPLYYFETPDHVDFGLTGATSTKVENYVTATKFSVAMFDAMVDDADIKNLPITYDGNAFSANQMANIILFETAAGRKGVVKTTALNSSRIMADIKVQKY